ncbi:hypothetical protein JTB14_035716 [Gonioctena quinquepunctata]|nr:hypothetical protein JTB14_035716 [Gonioctena quinquepunctata]
MKGHLMSKHQDENEVKGYSLLSDENPLKKLKLFQMRRDGNFQSFKESGRVIPARLLPQSVPSKTDYVACPTCFVILKKESLHRHVTKTCKGMPTSSSKGMTYRSRAVSEGIHSDGSDVMKNYVFPSFREGIIKECIRYDDMLIVYGNVMTAKYRNQHHYPMIRNRLIRMAEHCEIHFDKLSKKFDKQSWMELSGAVLLGLLIFNRRRPGELEKALLTDLDTLVSINKDKLLNHNLNDEEQKRVGVFSRFVVRGKLARGVPVLLHDSYKTCLDLVL